MGLFKFLKSCTHGPYEIDTLVWKYHLKCKLGTPKVERQNLIKELSTEDVLTIKPYIAKDGSRHFYICNSDGRDIGILFDDVSRKLNRLYPLEKYNYTVKVVKVFQDRVVRDYDEGEWETPVSWMCAIKLIVNEKVQS